MGILGWLFGVTLAEDAPASEPANSYAGAPPVVYDDEECDDDCGDGQAISVWDAADIYFDSGDEDRMFGYSHDELVNAHESGG